MNAKECVLFYVKFPEKGKVKTRLAKDIGDEQAVELYRCCILDMLETLACIPQQICICYAPEDAEQQFKNWLGREYLYMPQRGRDLGERMNNSFQEAFRRGFQNVCILGSDLPDLPHQHVVKAFEQLRAFESVIGPSGDGGYYLLGFRNEIFFSEVFQGIIWSHSSVYAETIKKLERRGIKFLILPAWNDIDNLTELQQWYRHNQTDHPRATRTFMYTKGVFS